MTKLKTKKGKPIAKRTLSVILAAAMVLSSNSLVWANADVEPQAEVEAAVVEEAATVAAVEDAEYTVDTNLVLGTADGSWGEDLELLAPEGETEKFEIKDQWDAVQTPAMKVEVYDSVDGLLETKENITDLAALKTAVTKSLTKNDFAKVYTVKVYVEDKELCTFESAPLAAVDISGVAINATTTTAVYNGKAQIPEAKLSGKYADAKVAVHFVDATEAKNVGEYKYQLVAAEDAYVGTTEVTADFEVTQATIDAKNVTAVISGTKEYTGAAQAPDVVVTDELSGEVMSSDFYDVTATNVEPGEKYTPENVTITLHEKAAGEDPVAEPAVKNNFTDGNVITKTGEYAISKLNLANLNNKYDITVADQKLADGKAEPKLSDVTITDKETGAVLTIDANEVDVTYANNTAKGNGSMTIAAKSSSTKYTGKITLSFRIVEGMIAESDIYVIGKDGDVEINKTLNNFKGNIKQSGKPYTEAAQEPYKELLTNGLYSRATDPAGKNIKFVCGKDYEISYANNVNASVKDNASVTIKFMGDYSGTFTYEFTIAKAEVELEAVNPVYAEDKDSYELGVVATTGTGDDKREVSAANYTVKAIKTGEKVGDALESEVTLTNKNYSLKDGKITGKVVGKSISDKSITATAGGPYTYTGKPAELDIVVTDNGTVLKEGTDYEIGATNGTEAGKATVTITGKGNYGGSRVLEYEIVKAELAGVEIEEKDLELEYNRNAQTPNFKSIDVKFNGVKLELDKDFTVSFDNKKSTDVGSYKFTLTAKEESKKVTGTFNGTYEIKPATLAAKFTTKSGNAVGASLGSVKYTGKAITLADFPTNYVVRLVDNTLLTEGKDYKLVYENNTNAGEATVEVVGMGNYTNEAIVGGKPVITPAATATFNIIENATIEKADVKKVNDVEYAGGLSVVPNLVVVVDGVTLVQGVDYVVTTDFVAANVGEYTGFTVKASGAYADTIAENAFDSVKWNVVAKDLKNCDVTVEGEDVTVMNGSVKVPASEYTVEFNEDGTATVSAAKDSKNYTGSVTVEVEESSTQVLDVVAKPYTKTKIHVTWRNIDGADSYVIYKDGVKIAEAEDGKEGYIDTGMHSYDGIYEYQVAAVFDGKEGTKSDVYESTTRPADPVVNKAFTHKNGIRVETKAKGADGYRVWIRQGGSNPTEYVEKKSTYGNYTFKDLKNGQKYVIKVQAYKLVNGKKVPSRKAVYVTGRAETAKKSLI